MFKTMLAIIGFGVVARVVARGLVAMAEDRIRETTADAPLDCPAGCANPLHHV